MALLACLPSQKFDLNPYLAAHVHGATISYASLEDFPEASRSAMPVPFPCARPSKALHCASANASTAERVLERPRKEEPALKPKPKKERNGLQKPESFRADRLDLGSIQPQRSWEEEDIGRLTPSEMKKLTDHLEQSYRKTPTASPKQELGIRWREYQGCANWEGLIDPLDPILRREIVKYGELAQATYDAFDFDCHSKYCGSCRYNTEKLLESVGLQSTGYTVTGYIHAMSSAHVPHPHWMKKSDWTDPWSKDSNWMGYVAVCTDEQEVKRLGRRDIVVAWRGTVTPLEWMENFMDVLHPIGDVEVQEKQAQGVKVERGFLHMYTSKKADSRYNKKSASEQVMDQVRRLVQLYGGRGEELSITVTGHSLGGALALLAAYEMAAKGTNNGDPPIPITVFSFAAPRVGNAAFRERLKELGVNTLRVVNRQDMVPKLPGVFFNEGLEKYEQVVRPLLEVLPWNYSHVGAQLQLDHRNSPFLKNNPDVAACHNLEAYLHLVDGFLSSSVPYRPDAKRDVALVNKASDMLHREMMVPPNWYQLQHKGLVQNSAGRWVQPDRHPDHIPSPTC